MGNFLLGLGVGLIGGTLFAPRSGSETREMLRCKANEGTDYLRARAEEGADYVKDRANELGTVASDMMEKGKQKLSSEARREEAYIRG
ncbi:MAG TPA: YtxH domain-containing protein [Bryobacteraceae bacterium]|nr:YtxH domain-containing protein [Bryobacteraceae bacterium]